ncbi:MAG: M23 family metallopeptidase [Clostridia bacterium]|nr:M23 family metallopeptidase [Clostridia bacterium]
MRRMIKKWGEPLLAALCVLAILFAALYTRQDDIRRMAARNAAASQDERLTEATEISWARPVEGAVILPFSGAMRENGIWRFSPYVQYATSYGEAVRALHPGVVLRAENDSVLLRGADGTESEYRGLASLRVMKNDVLGAGDILGSAGSQGFIEVSLWSGGGYADPETIGTSP